MSTDASSLPIQRLCSHHVVDNFECGDEAFDIVLEEYHSHVYDVYDQVAVLALVDGIDVVGYIAYKDMYIKAAESSAMRRMFLIPALAVTMEYQGGVAAGRLIDAAFAALDRRRADGHEYYGIACIPHTSAGIRALFKRLGFGPLASNEFFWWKKL